MTNFILILNALAVAAAQHVPEWRQSFHLASGNQCFETTYIDANYRAKGYEQGPCDGKYNDVLKTTTVTVCNHHSDKNLKYCPNTAVEITVATKGIASFAAVERLAAAADGACTNSADASIYNTKGKANFQSDLTTCGKKCFGAKSCVSKCMVGLEGYSSACADCFGDLTACTEKNCLAQCAAGNSPSCTTCQNAHCVTPFQTCSGLTVPTTTTMLVAVDPEPTLYHLVGGNDGNQCDETLYNDDAFTAKGWKQGRCSGKFNTVLKKTKVMVCDGQSQTNLKYCPDTQTEIIIVRKGITGFSE
jgi:hypothetical protein